MLYITTARVYRATMKKLASSYLLLWMGCSAHLAFGQLPPSSIVTTFAGSAWKFQGDGGPAISAPVSSFSQLAPLGGRAIELSD
jgi:hypothetical protein